MSGGLFDEQSEEIPRCEERRRFIRLAGIGTAIAALGGWYFLADAPYELTYAELRGDNNHADPWLEQRYA